MDISPDKMTIAPFVFNLSSRLCADPDCTGNIYSVGANSSILVLSAGQFSFSDVIEDIIEQIGQCHLFISTWTASAEGIRKAFDFLSSDKIISVKFLLDRGFKQFKGPAYDYLISKFSSDCIRTTRIHAKFAVLKNDDYAIVIRTSANLNKNTRTELFEITNSREMSDFFIRFFDIAWSRIKSTENFELSSSQKLKPIINEMDVPVSENQDSFLPTWLK